MSSTQAAEADSTTSSNVLQPPPFRTPENMPRIPPLLPSTSRNREGSSNRGGARAVRIRPTPQRKMQPAKKQLRFIEEELIDQDATTDEASSDDSDEGSVLYATGLTSGEECEDDLPKEVTYHLGAGGRVLVDSFRCFVCKKIPRPILLKEAFAMCPTANHITCSLCLPKMKLQNWCKGCNRNHENWEPLSVFVVQLYKDMTKLCFFECHRDCGRNFAGHDKILEHDASCNFGRQMFCPLDQCEIKMYRHEKHLSHCKIAEPISHDPRKWSIVFDWDPLLVKHETLQRGDTVDSQILYMETEHNYTFNIIHNTTDPYTPKAVCAIFKFVKSHSYYSFEEATHKNIITCSLNLEWLEREPNSKYWNTNHLYFDGQEVTHRTRDCVIRRSFEISPTYQMAPPALPGPSSKKYEKRRRPNLMAAPVGGPTPPIPIPTNPLVIDLDSCMGPQIYEFQHPGVDQSDNFIETCCARCGSHSKGHTHFDFQLMDARNLYSIQ